MFVQLLKNTLIFIQNESSFREKLKTCRAVIYVFGDDFVDDDGDDDNNNDDRNSLACLIIQWSVKIASASQILIFFHVTT